MTQWTHITQLDGATRGPLAFSDEYLQRAGSADALTRAADGR